MAQCLQTDYQREPFVREVDRRLEAAADAFAVLALDKNPSCRWHLLVQQVMAVEYFTRPPKSPERQSQEDRKWALLKERRQLREQLSFPLIGLVQQLRQSPRPSSSHDSSYGRHHAHVHDERDNVPHIIDTLTNNYYTSSPRPPQQTHQHAANTNNTQTCTNNTLHDGHNMDSKGDSGNDIYAQLEQALGQLTYKTYQTLTSTERQQLYQHT